MTVSNVEKGNNFEKEIADLYKLMGYDVELNVSLSGQQVDILATKKISGSGVYKLLIECKYKGNGKSAGNEDIQSIAGAYQIARANHSVHNCIVVTNNTFTTPAKEAANSFGVFLKTYEQLISELIDFTSYKKKLLETYREEFGIGENSWYIKNSARVGKEKIQDLDKYIKEWLFKEDKEPIVIKGGYGTGKTSFCKHFASKIIEDKEEIIPVIIYLRDFQKRIHIESVIRDFLDDNCEANLPKFEVFWKMYLEGKLLIFFDGFDEMAARIDPTDTEANLIEIEKFSKKGGNVIVTCRPEYFISEKEESKAWNPKSDPINDRRSNYVSIDLELWDDIQVRNYIEKRLSQQDNSNKLSVQDFIDVLDNVAQIGDVSTRAVHLEITIRILPYMLKQNISFTRSNLYKTYILKEFEREVIKNKRIRSISDEDRFMILKDIAFKNFMNSSDEINFSIAADVIGKKLDLPSTKIDWVTRDFLNRSFLSRKNNIYRFSHKSLGEYLVASKLYDLITEKDFSFLNAKNFSSAIVGIVLELLGGINDFLKLVNLFEIESNKSEVIRFKKIQFLSLGLFDIIRTQLHFKSNNYETLTHEMKEMLSVFHDQIYTSQHIIRMTSDEYIDVPNARKTLEVGWNNLLDSFLWFKGVEDGNKVYLKTEQLNISELIRECSLKFTELMVNITGRINSFNGDKILLTRIFDNLIKNANDEIKEMEVVPKLDVEISEKFIRRKKYLYLKFINESRKIEPNVFSRLFDFGVTTKSEGYGIGLYVVKSMIAIHGGTVKIFLKKRKFIVEIYLLDHINLERN